MIEHENGTRITLSVEVLVVQTVTGSGGESGLRTCRRARGRGRQYWPRSRLQRWSTPRQFTLTNPNPRFIFSYFTFHQDVGVFIVPEHI
jgi:hypothetical protein